MQETKQQYINFYDELEKKIIEKELLEELITQYREQLRTKEEEISESIEELKKYSTFNKKDLSIIVAELISETTGKNYRVQICQSNEREHDYYGKTQIQDNIIISYDDIPKTLQEPLSIYHTILPAKTYLFEVPNREKETEITIYTGFDLEKGLIINKPLDKLPYYVKNFFKCITETKIHNHKENMSLEELRLLKDMFISANSKHKQKTYFKTNE